MLKCLFLIWFNMNQLSNYIDSEMLSIFWVLLNKHSEDQQIKILNEINQNYIESTGYGGFHNYEIFSTIMYNYIKQKKCNLTKNSI